MKNKLKILLFYDLVLVSSSENLFDIVKEKLTGKNVYEIFEFPYVYGQSIYFIPDLTRLEKQEELPNYEFKLFDGNILDWGFWRKYNRGYVTEYFKNEGIDVEWHYINIDDVSWEQNI